MENPFKYKMNNHDAVYKLKEKLLDELKSEFVRYNSRFNVKELMI